MGAAHDGQAVRRARSCHPRTPAQGRIEYLQLPALDLEHSAAFYGSVFGWAIDISSGSFEAPGMIGQLTTDAAPATTGGPVLWISANSLYRVLGRVEANGGKVRGRPQLEPSCAMIKCRARFPMRHYWIEPSPDSRHQAFVT